MNDPDKFVHILCYDEIENRITSTLHKIMQTTQYNSIMSHVY